MRATRQSRTTPFLSTRLLATTALAAITLIAMGSPARAVDDSETPIGEHVVGGSASFNRPETGLLNVKQNTNRVVIDWNSFNIGKNAKTEFFQPGKGSLAVNRVTGQGDDPSQILGTLKANGNIMVLDRNGVLFGANSTIDVNGIIASTGNINIDDVMNGNSKIVLSNFGNGAVINEGTINAAEAGLVAFVAPTVANSGVINAKLGRVALASGGESATVDLYGDGLVEIALGDSKSKALVKNTGSIDAEGGTVLMTTSAAKGVVDNIINTSGIVKVSSVEMNGGKIILHGGKVNVSGKIEANGKNGGGSIDVKGNDVEIASSATVSADAIENGNGGTIHLIADHLMTYRGLTTAHGGAEGGNGGFAEISGYDGLIYQGLADMTAANGMMGDVLLDPRITIIHSGPAAPSIFDPYVLSAEVLALNLKLANLTVQADDFIDVGTSEGSYSLAITGDSITDAALNLFLDGLPDGNIDLSVWTSPPDSGQTTGSLTLQSDVVNFNRDLMMGKGSLTVDAGTINLDGTIRGLDAPGTGTVLFNSSRMSSNTLAINVLSNEAMIQQAVDLAASGAVIDVAADDYAESILVNKSLTLNGANQGLAGNDSGRGSESRILPHSPGFYVKADNVTIDGFAIDGADDGILVEGANSVTLKNNVITNSSQDGIKASKGAGITIENNLVDGTGDDGIHVEKNDGTIRVSGNIVRSTADEGIEVHGHPIRGSGAIIIDGNTVDGASGTGVHGDGIQVAWSSTSTDITDNTVTDTHGDGIEVHSSNGGNITGNTLSGNLDQGIEVSRNSDNFLIDDNDISDSSREGIYVDGGSTFTISNNDVETSGQDGIHVQNVWDSLSINNNSVINSAWDGISTDDTGFTTIDDNIVVFSGESGIQSTYANTLHISGNGIALAGDEGIYVYESGFDESESGWGVEITGNDIVLTGDDGIYAEYVGSTLIADNEVALAGSNFWDWYLPDFYDEGYDFIEEYPYDETVTFYWGYGDGIHVENAYRSSYGEGKYQTESLLTEESEGGDMLDLLITGNNVRWIGGDGIDVRNSGITEISDNTVGYTGIEGTTYSVSTLEDLVYDITDPFSDDLLPTDEEDGDVSLIAFLGDILPEPEEFMWKDGNGIYVQDTGNPDSFYAEDFSDFDSLGESDYGVRILGNTVSMTGGDGIESYYNGWNLIADNDVDNAGQQFINGYDGGYEDYFFTKGPDRRKEGTGDGIRVDNGTIFPSYDDFSLTRVTGNNVVDSYEDNIHVIDVNRSSVDNNNTSFTDGFAYGENNIVVESVPYPIFTQSFESPYFEYPYGESYGYETRIVDNMSVDNAPQNGILIESINNSLISGNIVTNSGANGLFASGPDHGAIVVADNTFTDNIVGAKFESGIIDLTGGTNSFTGGDVGLLFAPSVMSFEDESSSYADMSLVNDTIGTSTFDGQSTYYVELENGAFFAPGLPTLLNGNDATFDGLTPGLTGGVLTQTQYDTLEAMLYHYNDDTTLGLFFFEIGENGIPDINQEDIFNKFGGFNVPNPGLRVTITGLPNLPGQGGPQEGSNGFNLANIEPAAGGEPSDQNPEDIEPAAGAGQGGNQGTENSCWSDTIAGLPNGPSTLDYGDTPDESLEGASQCQSDQI